jgi:hypothetical protein
MGTQHSAIRPPATRNTPTPSQAIEHGIDAAVLAGDRARARHVPRHVLAHHLDQHLAQPRDGAPGAQPSSTTSSGS